MKSLVTLLGLAILLGGCSTASRFPRAVQQKGESVVLVGEEPAFLAHAPLKTCAVRVRASYLQPSTNSEWTEGRDYALDYTSGAIRRLPGSRIPDFQTNMLFCKTNFNHGEFPGFGNRGFFAFVDYSYKSDRRWPVQESQAACLKATRAKLRSGKPVKIVAFGDSITAGGDVPDCALFFWQRWADALQKKYPKSRVVAVNGATGGDNTVQGLARLSQKVISEKPDLVLVAFGMNDHNVSGVPIPNYETNLCEIIRRVRVEAGAEVILVSAFPPNPNWRFGSHHMQDYAAATAYVARQTHCAYADVFTNWQALASRKKPEDLLANNINHPNEFGHWIYFKVLEKVL